MTICLTRRARIRSYFRKIFVAIQKYPFSDLLQLHKSFQGTVLYLRECWIPLYNILRVTETVFYFLNIKSTHITMILFQIGHHTYAGSCIKKNNEVMGINFWWGNQFGITDHIHRFPGLITLIFVVKVVFFEVRK